MNAVICFDVQKYKGDKNPKTYTVDLKNGTVDTILVFYYIIFYSIAPGTVSEGSYYRPDVRFTLSEDDLSNTLMS